MFKFNAIDDYFHLFGDQKYLEQGNDFKALISKYFDKKDNAEKRGSLIFCLIEKVTLQNLDAAIGETLLYSPFFDEQKNEAILKEYQDIIRKVQNTFKFSIASYKDWYTREAYILIKENNSTSTFGDTKWRRDGKAQLEDRDRKDYAQKDEELDEKALLQYLEFYAKQLHENQHINLKQYPHYAIIVRPIAVRLANGSIFPLGNLYLHFATKEAKDENFYARFLNDLLVVWMKNTGGTLVQQIKRQAVSEQREAHKDFIPNLGKAGMKKWNETKSKQGYTLNDLCRSFVEGGNDLNAYQENLKKLQTEFIPILLKKANIWELPELKTFADFKVYWRTGGKSGPQNIEEFVDMLLRRNIVFIGIFLFDYLVGEMHSLLSGAGLTAVEYDPRSRTVYSYLWVNLLISTGDGAHIKREQQNRILSLKESIYSTLSKNEKLFLSNCYKFVLEQIPSELRSKFDNLVFDRVKSGF